MFVEPKFVEPRLQLTDWHLHKFGDASSAHFHPRGLLLEFRSVTVGTHGLSSVAAHHHAILYLVLVFLHHLKESVDTDLFVYIAVFFARQAVPKHILILAFKLVIRFKDRKVVSGCTPDELGLPAAHLVSVPALYAAFVDTECRVGNDQLLVYPNHIPEALAGGTGSQRRVERKHVVVGFCELDTIGFEAC